MTPDNRKSGRTSHIGTSSEPGHGKLKKEDAQERELDEALDDTFPASDPVALTPEPDEDKVDEGLAETFPASDPVAVNPHPKEKSRS